MREKQMYYDTGKVKIGIYYQQPQHRPTREELKMQSVLLGDRQPVTIRLLALKMLDKAQGYFKNEVGHA